MDLFCPVTCEAGSHLFSRLKQLSSLQGTLSVHILPPLQELSHGILDLLSANPLHDLQTRKTGITHLEPYKDNTLYLNLFSASSCKLFHTTVNIKR